MASGNHVGAPRSEKMASLGLTAVGVFLFFGAGMAALAAVTLGWPGTFLDHAWRINPSAYQELAPLGRRVGLLFVILSLGLAAAGVGWFGRRLWGWRLAVIIIAAQVLGNLVSLLRGDFLRGAVGFSVAGMLLLYLLSTKVRTAFVKARTGTSVLTS